MSSSLGGMAILAPVRAMLLLRHLLSEKHLQRYVNEFSGRHNIRSLDTIDQMASVAKGMDGKRLTYRDLVG